MVVRVSQKWRGPLEVSTPVQCHSATALDTNGTLSFQSLIVQDEGHTPSSTQPRGEDLQAQQPLQPGSLLNGTITAPAVSKVKTRSSSEERMPATSSTQKETELLQRLDGCGRKLSFGSSEETHGKRKKRLSTSMSFGNSPTLNQRPWTGFKRLVPQERTDSMEGSLTTKVSLPPVTDSRARPCQENSDLFRACRGTKGQLRSKSSGRPSGHSTCPNLLAKTLGDVQQDAQTYSCQQRGCHTSNSIHRLSVSSTSKGGIYHDSTSKHSHVSEPVHNDTSFLQLIGGPIGGNWVKSVAPSHHDRKKLKEERWPSIHESTRLHDNSTQPVYTSKRRRHSLYPVKETTGPSYDLESGHTAVQQGFLPPVRKSRPHSETEQRGYRKSNRNFAEDLLSHGATKCTSRASMPINHYLAHLNIRCIGKGMTLEQAPERRSRVLLPSLQGRKHCNEVAAYTSVRGKEVEKSGEAEPLPQPRNCQLPAERADPSYSYQTSCNTAVSNNAAEKTEPVLMMVNKDFAVTTPVKGNLLLTIALTRAKDGFDDDCDYMSEKHRLDTGGSLTAKCGKILVGHFTAFSSFMGFLLGHEAKRVATTPNAGGKSTISEVLSVEYFVRTFQAKDVVSETEVEYSFVNMKKVDYICTIFGRRVGVSVTRAMSYPDPEKFTEDTAIDLLRKKLFGLVVARRGVKKRHGFSQCILHVWCETRKAAKIVEDKYPEISTEMEVSDDVIMVLTVAEGAEARPIFYESCLTSKLPASRKLVWC